jgi:two-component system response regulator FlrC
VSAVPPAPSLVDPVAQPALQAIPQALVSSATSVVSTNMKDLERQHILDTLAKVGGSRKKAIELLGISERTLRYKLAQYREEGLLGDDDQE